MKNIHTHVQENRLFSVQDQIYDQARVQIRDQTWHKVKYAVLSVVSNNVMGSVTHEITKRGPDMFDVLLD